MPLTATTYMTSFRRMMKTFSSRPFIRPDVMVFP